MNDQHDKQERKHREFLAVLDELEKRSRRELHERLTEVDILEDSDLSGRETVAFGNIAYGSPVMISISEGYYIDCEHDWTETQGFMRTYQDCKKCGAKREDI